MMRRSAFVPQCGPSFLAVVALAAGLAFAAPASAQVCPYNSTQSTCACPISGGGTTCFGGQLYRSTDSSCQSDARPCAANQQWNCSTEACECNTTNYPCGGCSAATSSVGATCSSPSGGKYTNVCGACSCPAGTTLCSSSNACVTNLSCPAGTTFDPCTNTCGTPYVLLSPSATQSGYIQVNGDIKTTAGNFFLPNGKAVHVDASGATTLNVGNYGSGATGFTLNVIGTLGGNQLCISGDCRGAWPSTSTFDPAYVNASGDTMSGTLNVSGASSNLYVGGNLGVGTTSPAAKLDVAGAARMAGFQLTTGAVAGRVLTSDASGNGTWQAPPIPVASVSGSGAGISVSPTTGNVVVSNTGVTSLLAGAGISVSAATGAVTVSNTGLTGSGTANYLPKYLGATTLGNSKVYDNGTNVGVGTTSPAYALDVAGTVHASTGGANGVYANGATSGVYGLGGGIGVQGSGTVYGIYGSGPTGAYGSGTNYGVYGSATTYGVFGTGTNYGVYGSGSYTGVQGLGNTGVSGVSYATSGIGGSFTASGSGGMGLYASGSSWGVYSAGGSNYFNGRVGIANQYPSYPLDIQGPGNAAIRLAGSYIGDNWDGTLHIQSGGGAVAFDGYDTVYISSGSALNLGGVSRTSWPSLSVINTGTTLYTWQGAGWKSVGCPGGYSITGWSGYNCMSHGGEWECSSSYMHPTYVDVWYSAEANAYVSINCAAVY